MKVVWVWHYDGNQQLKGIITDGDVRRALTANGADTLNKTAKELMTSSPKTIHENEFLAKAEDLMKEKKIHLLLWSMMKIMLWVSGVLKLMINEKLKKIKLVITDVDGVLTDGLLHYDANGEVD